MNENLNMRQATVQDLDEISALESACFPAAEAASRESFEWRLKSYPQHFWVLTKNDKIISFVNGPVTKEKDLIDEMYDSASYCDESGKWQMIFGVVTHPDEQHHGFASMVMRRFIDEAKKEGRSGVVLTCKVEKLKFYEGFEFIDEGLSTSTHGGVPWHQMRLTF